MKTDQRYFPFPWTRFLPCMGLHVTVSFRIHMNLFPYIRYFIVTQLISDETLCSYTELTQRVFFCPTIQHPYIHHFQRAKIKFITKKF